MVTPAFKNTSAAVDPNMSDPVIEKKYRLSSGSRIALTILAAGFTLISAWNGFTFYKVLFGISMAILISSTFEVTRLACLFSFMRTGKRITTLAAATYLIVASVCAFAAINSFTYEVIKREQSGRDQYRGQIHNIKQAYSQSVAEKITQVAREITHVQKVLASYPDSATWKRRLATAVAERGQLVAQRDKFLNEEPDNPQQWIKANSALLGMKLEEQSRDRQEMNAVTRALKELWGLEKATAQKIMGIIITVTVELSILLLSFLAVVADRSRSVAGVADRPRPRDVAGVADKSWSVAGVVDRQLPRDVAGADNKSWSVAGVADRSRGVASVADKPQPRNVTGVAGKPQSVADLPEKPLIVAKSATETKKTATPAIDENTLEKFMAVYKEHFNKNGELPPMRILSRKQRKVRKFLETFNLEDMEKLLNINSKMHK